MDSKDLAVLRQENKPINVVKLNEEIATYYQHLFCLVPKAANIILHSGRGVTKSTFLSMWTLWRLLQLKKSDVMILGYEYSSMADKVFADFMFAGKEILHLPEEQFEPYYNSTGEMWIKVHNKWGTNKIWFKHAKYGAENLKGSRPTPGNQWVELRFYELTNFLDWNAEEIEKTVATFIRNAQANIHWDKVEQYCKANHIVEFRRDEKWLKKQLWYYKNFNDLVDSLFYCVYEFNTPSAGANKGAWVLDWLQIEKKKPNTYYQFNTYLDMTELEQYRFLGPQALERIRILKETDPITYNHEYLGKMPYDGDLTFPLVNRATHYGHHENFEPDVLVIGVDVGRSDATVCTLNGFEFREKDLRVELAMKQWYHCNRKAEFVKDEVRHFYKAMDVLDTSNMILEFCEMVHEMYPTQYIYFRMDYAGEGKAYYDLCFPHNQHPMWLNVRRDWDKIMPETRIDLINIMLTIPGLLKFGNIHEYEAYKHQVYGKMGPNGERKRLDDPTKPSLDMDRQDSTEYGVLEELYKVITERIKNSKGKYVKQVKPLF